MSEPATVHRPSSLTVTSAARFADLRKFQEHVQPAVQHRQDIGEHHTFVFEDVPPSWGWAVSESLYERITSR